MSRYEINKFIRYTDNHADRISAFAADTETWVMQWASRAADASPFPVPDGGLLTEAEQAAVIAEDYSTLYQMGTHPYLLFHFVRAVDMARGTTPWPEFVERYRSFVAPHGEPDFGT